MTDLGQVLIEGFRPNEVLEALGPELEAEVVSGQPLVVRVGTADVLLSLAIEGSVLRAELAHVDGGGEGVLPALIPVVVRLAQRRGATEIEWLVFATNCARPNPRLRPILERRGFVVREIPGRGFCYQRRDGIGRGDATRNDSEGSEEPDSAFGGRTGDPAVPLWGSRRSFVFHSICGHSAGFGWAFALDAVEIPLTSSH